MFLLLFQRLLRFLSILYLKSSLFLMEFCMVLRLAAGITGNCYKKTYLSFSWGTQSLQIFFSHVQLFSRCCDHHQPLELCTFHQKHIIFHWKCCNLQVAGGAKNLCKMCEVNLHQNVWTVLTFEGTEIQRIKNRKLLPERISYVAPLTKSNLR